ncbi:Flp pilus assembly protein CpaB [Aquibacillus sediminis]|uniref:Flp pilus assembly protein CpaB n=1 Tax=Aquibacillus sediminis TaxID=2574734 RepID=UPI001108C48F|nr:Flp pilus assembly protein CpaB [Aquibacillus sediminis]
MKSRIIFLLAIIMSIITTILFFQFINQEDTQDIAEQPLTDVVVAVESIAPNQMVNRDLVEIRRLPTENVHPSALTSLEDIDGMYAVTTIETGEIVLAHRVKGQEEEQQVLSRKIANGNRAVSIGVNVVQSVSNLIQPEDYVDVVFTDTETNQSTPLLSNVRVLATGRRMTPITEGETLNEYSSITLELTASEANTLIEAHENGNIHLMLHSGVTETND